MNFQKEKQYLEEISNVKIWENPHQRSSIYVNDYDDKHLGFSQIHGKELSYNNYNDMFASLKILNTLKKILEQCSKTASLWSFGEQITVHFF